MGRVIANLLSNAIKHTPEGGTITLGSESRRGGTVFFVRDTGEGIEAAHHHLIFEKFRQVEARKLGLKTDRGLGLTFCKMAVEAHGGRIWLESAPQKGSTFYVSLPGQEAQPQTPPSHEAPSLVSISGQERR
jgi:signal transduction histidine kinase